MRDMILYDVIYAFPCTSLVLYALQSCESTPEGDRGSSPSWDRDSAFSRTASNLSEQEEQPSSPGSERSSANGNGGMKLSSSTSSLAELVRKRLDESEAESTTFSQRSPTRSEGPETGEFQMKPY